MQWEKLRDNKGNLPAYAWPGGYAVAYICGDGEMLCAKCVNSESEVTLISPAECQQGRDGEDPAWQVIGFQTADWHDVGDPSWDCAHCGAEIEPRKTDGAVCEVDHS